MSAAQQGAQVRPRVQAEALADALHQRGITTIVLAKGGHRAHPCVQAALRRTWYLTGNVFAEQGRATFIYLAPGDDGRWWFWWPSLTPLAPASDIPKAADAITHALKHTAGQTAPANGSPAGQAPTTATGTP
jgi:hypothetical protein